MKLQIIRQRGLWWTISIIVIVAGLAAMILSWTQMGSPLRPSLDFTGGTRLQYERDCTVPNNCDAPIDIAKLREVMESQGLGNASIQIIGEDRQGFSVRVSALGVDDREKLESALTQAIGQFDGQRSLIDTVGPTLGKQIFTSGMLALVISYAAITVYLTFRFELDYAVFALVALFHDVLVTMGVFAGLGLAMGTEVDTLFIVALLTIVGFSVNDTVVIYDRVRETLALNPGTHIDDIVDAAVNQTLARSINTTLSTLLPLIAIFLFSVGSLKFFALALLIGFISGAYSSIFIASTLLAWWRERTGRAVMATVGVTPEGVEGSDSAPSA